MTSVPRRVRLLTTGLSTHEVQAACLPEQHWDVTAVEPAPAGPGWRRRLDWVKRITQTDLWYSSGGISTQRAEWLARLAHAVRTAAVFHWTGTDVLRARAHFRHRPRELRWLARRVDHWAGAPWFVDELAEIGIAATFVPKPNLRRKRYLEMPTPPLPPDFGILTYLPPRRAEFYGWSLVRRLAEECPAITIDVLAASPGDLRDAPPNTRLLGWLDEPLDAYVRATVLVRMTEHDGYARGVLDALALGRHAIWTLPHPGSLHATSYTALRDHVKDLQRRHALGELHTNAAGRAFVSQHLDPEATAHNFDRRLRAAHERRVSIG